MNLEEQSTTYLGEVPYLGRRMGTQSSRSGSPQQKSVGSTWASNAALR
jgi:hypothetical protein